MEENKAILIKKIKKQIPLIDKTQYAHNIVNLLLNELDLKYGEEEVINLIKSTQLINLGWGDFL